MARQVEQSCVKSDCQKTRGSREAGDPLTAMWRTAVGSVVVALLLLVPISSHAQIQAPPQQLDWSADDAKRAANLQEQGVRTDGVNVALWTPAGVLDSPHAAELVARLDQGVKRLRSLIGSHPWQHVKEQRIVYFVVDERFPSHTNGDESVFIPLVRLQDGKAPFLHEAAHALLSRGPLDTDDESLPPELSVRIDATRPQWLIEGIADYFGQAAAKAAGVTEGDVFENGGIDEIDNTCAKSLATPAGEEIAPYIGGLGYFAPLSTTDRMKYAPGFYGCSFSFTKYLAGQIGDAELINLMELQSKADRSTNPIRFRPDGVLPRIEKLTGKPAAVVRTDWLKQIASRQIR